jgi:hypothetical protein
MVCTGLTARRRCELEADFRGLTISSSAAKRKERKRLTMSPLQRGVRWRRCLPFFGTLRLCLELLQKLRSQ